MSERNVHTGEAIAAECDVEAAEQALDRAREQQQAERKKLYESIATGKTTGAPLMDLVILRHRGEMPQDAIEAFHDLQGRIRLHLGEPALVIMRETGWTPARLYPRPLRHPSVIEHRGIGMLGEPTLSIGQRGDWALPTDSYVLLSDAQEDLQLIGEPLTTHVRPGSRVSSPPLERAVNEEVTFPPGIGEEWVTGEWKNEDRPFRLEIAIGTQEIATLIEAGHFDPEEYRIMLEVLESGRPSSPSDS